MLLSFQDKTIEVNSINTTLMQIPDSTNKLTAIVNFQIQTVDHQCINDLGIVEGSKGQSTKDIIDNAIEQAKSSIFSVVETKPTQQSRNQSNTPNNNAGAQSRNYSDKTEKQIRCAYAVAKEKHLNLDDVANQMFRKKFDFCSKDEASNIIDFLKNDSGQNNDENVY